MKFMCMRFKNWDKGEIHRAFHQFCAESYFIVFTTK